MWVPKKKKVKEKELEDRKKRKKGVGRNILRGAGEKIKERDKGENVQKRDLPFKK